MIPVVVGIDPGLRACGVSLVSVQTSALVRAWLSKNPEKKDDGAAAWLSMAHQVAHELGDDEAAHRPRELRIVAIYVERQQIRAVPGEDGKLKLITMNPSQILGLAYVVGALLAVLSAPAKTAIYPSEWQGPMQGRKRAIDRQRKAAGLKGIEYGELVWEALPHAERLLAEGAEKSTGHNVVEGVGISKWGVARVRAGVI